MKTHFPSVVFLLANHLRRLYWLLLRPRRFGVKVLLVNQDKILLVRHSYTKGWTLPGGGFRPTSELPEDAARREVREELGVECGNITLLGKYESQLEYKRDTIYCLRATLDDQTIQVSGEIKEARWYTTKSVPSDISTAATKVLQMTN